MAKTSEKALVRVEHLFKHFGAGSARVDALNDIDMEVFPGQVVGLMGPSGSGKMLIPAQAAHHNEMMSPAVTE